MKHFDASRRLIYVGDTIVRPISLDPLVSQIMSRLPEPNREFNISEVDSFIANHGGPKRLLPHFLNSLSGLKSGSFHFDIYILKESFKKISWLFTQISSKESIANVPSCGYIKDESQRLQGERHPPNPLL